MKEYIKKVIRIIVLVLCIVFGLATISFLLSGMILQAIIFGIISVNLGKISKAFDVLQVLNKKISDLEIEKENKKNLVDIEVQEYKNQLINKNEYLEDSIKQLKNKIKDLNSEIDLLEQSLTDEYIDEYNYADITSEQIKNELSLLNLKEKEMSRNNEIVTKKDEKVSKQLERRIIKTFSSDFNYFTSKLTLNNIDTTRNKVIKSYEIINKLYSEKEIKLSKTYLELKLEELICIYRYQKKLLDEKEQQKAIKEQMLEEAKLKKELEEQKKRIAKEEKMFGAEISKLMKYLNSSDSEVEKSLYIEKIKELEGKLKQLQEDKENVIKRELNTRAGHVYIISNVGSFGDNVYKIGMTRRFEPMDRVKELGSASVPFEFDVHAMIFSEDAPSLENKLHNHFKDKQINKVNSRKEFFKVDINEIEKVVLENHNATVEFTKLAKAEQYRASLKLEKKKNK